MSHFIDNKWIEGEGPQLVSINPANGDPCWKGRNATKEEVDAAMGAARRAVGSWSSVPFRGRVECLKAFEKQLKDHQDELSEAISIETGKPRWDSLTEVEAMIGKVSASIDAFCERRQEVVQDLGGLRGVTRYKPHGVVAVFGPFNFPGHVANGHIVPAVLAGNTVVFKPSRLTPMVAQKTVELWQAAGAPAGVINLVQGGRETGAALSGHPGHDGILFTGSHTVGLSLLQLMLNHTGKIIALEMGGNNAIVVHDAADLDSAAYLTIQSAYITSGQRCTCARRLIVPRGRQGDRFIERLSEMISGIRVGRYTDEPEPFMGPVIDEQAAGQIIASYEQIVNSGGKPLVEMRELSLGRAFLSPSLIDVTAVNPRLDCEIFGPLLQVIRAKDFDSAIREANNTAYGLAAALFSDNPRLWEEFVRRIRAGAVNWNRQTTGASSRLPFGGVGLSGNHRPSGYFASDYCSYPVASIESDRVAMPKKPTPGIEVLPRR